MDKENKITSDEINNLYERHLTKTAVKSILWLFLAYVITYFFPSATWVWYIVVLFILIAIGFSFFTKYLSYKVAKQERIDDGSA